MADKSDNPLDKAEDVARRILDRLGLKLDNRLAPAGQAALGARQISDLTTRIERAIEANLQTAESGSARIAPNRFRVLLTYEETSSLTPEYMEAVSKELTNTVQEYITNRRYRTPGRIEIEVSRDLFAKTTVVKADFSPDNAMPGKDPVRQAASTAPASVTPHTAKTVILTDASGNEYRLLLQSNGSPACIGRTAGNTVRINDESISRVHCSLALKPSGDVIVADLGSANGTFVNNSRLAPDEARKVTSGDLLRLGDLALTVARFL